MNDRTTIAVFADRPAVAAYLADIVRHAGMPVAKDRPADLTLRASTGINIETADGEILATLPMPVRAAKIIEQLQRAVKDGRLPSRITLCGGTLDVRESLWQPETGPAVRLTEKETAILVYLHGAGKGTVNREHLLTHVWAYAKEVETHTLETHIYRLRQKIEIDPANPLILLTKEDGYSLA